MEERSRAIRVWDLPTRLFHWSLALAFVIAFLSADSEKLRDIHVFAGYTLGGLIGFRIVWGFIGGQHSRFADFLPTPAGLRDYLKSLLEGEPRHYVGHNPAGAVAIFLLLGLGIGATASGYAVYNDIGGHLMEAVHEAAANGMMALVAIHLAGVIVSSWLHRENLVLAMISGWKKRTEDRLSARANVSSIDIQRGGRN